MLGQQEYRINYDPPDRRSFQMTLLMPRVDVWADREPVGSVLKRLEPKSGFRIAKTNVRLSGKTSARLINVPLDVALNRILRPLGAKATVCRDEGYVIIDDAFSLELPELAEPRVTLEFKAVDVRDALRKWAKDVGVSYTIAADVAGQVTLKLGNEHPYTALRRIIEPLGIEAHFEGGLLNFTAVKSPEGHPISPAHLANPIGYFVIGDESRRAALTRFARQTWLPFEVDADVNLEGTVSFLSSKSSVGETLGRIVGPENSFEIDSWRIRVRRR